MENRSTRPVGGVGGGGRAASVLGSGNAHPRPPAPEPRAGRGRAASDATALWRKALSAWASAGAAEAAGLCIAAEPYLPDLADRTRSLSVWDWRQGALAAAAVPARPWDGDPGALPPAVADLALLDLATLHGRGSFEQALRGAVRVLRPGGALLLRGGNGNGVGGAARRLREWLGGAETLAYGGGHRVLAAVRPEAPLLPAPGAVRWETVEVAGVALRLRQTPGVFAEGLLDPGTALLAEAAGPLAAGRCACDLGCGTGAVGMVLLARGAGHCTFVDEDLRALASLRQNLGTNRAADPAAPAPAAADVRAADAAGVDVRPPAPATVDVRAADAGGVDMRAPAPATVDVRAVDAAAGVPGAPYDLVVCNPPFHRGPEVAYGLTEAVLRAGWEALAPGGTLVAVGMRFLPLHRWLPGAHEVAGDRSYRVLAATRRIGGRGGPARGDARRPARG